MRSVPKLTTFILLFTAGCAGHAPVSVTEAGSGFRAAPRPTECHVEFFRTKAPEAVYDELGALHWEGRASAGQAQDELRRAACKLGADAVIVTHDYVPGGMQMNAYMTGTAVKYRVAPAGGGKTAAPAGE